MPPNAQHYQAQESTVSAKSRLVSLLTGCTPERLASFTAEGLAKTHRVKFADVVVMLERERGRRGASY